ncbi:hypothetical protein Ndes2526B_g09599 [Nannochloris sp. 'desiccata']|nr:putative Testis-expressed protein 2 [Chlorella desiccata (nom. nud.)]KAH7615754.1 putative Testis-expressed protein 2 [Chlorella desiccata (nom. nud.)]
MPGPTQGAGGALVPSLVTEKQEAIAIATVGTACGLYIFKSVPSLFLPQGIFALLASLFLGLFLGLALAGAVLCYIFYRFTHPKPPPSVPNLPLHAPLAAVPTPTAGGTSKRCTTLPARDVTRPSATMPHAYTSHGELHGVIFTVTQSHWDRTACVLDWPPAGKAFKTWHASLNQGTLVLNPLPRPHHSQHQGEEGTNKKGRKQHTGDRVEEENENDEKEEDRQLSEVVETAAMATGAAQTAVENQSHGIPLEGCTVELVRDGLQGRSELARKAPLLLAHPSWPLLDGEKKIFIFATDSAAKQEWLHALSYWCVNSNGGDGWEGSLKSIEETYQLFCSTMAQKSTLPFVQEKFNPSFLNTREGGATAMAPAVGVPSSGGPGSSSFAAGSGSRRSRDVQQGGGGQGREDAKLGKRASWKQWRKTRQEQGGEEDEHIEEDIGGDGVGDNNALGKIVNDDIGISASAATGAAAAAALDLQLRPPVGVEQVATTASDIDSIIEMRWMQSRKVPVPLAPQKQERKGSGGGGDVGAGGNTDPNATSLETSITPSPTPSPYLSPVKVPPIGPVVYRKGLPSTQQQQQQQQSGRAAPGGPSRPSSSLPGSAQTSPTKFQQRAQETPLSPSNANYANNNQQQPQQQTLSPRSQPAQTTAASSRLPQGFPSPLLPFDFFINATATRACFDLLRNPAFSEHVRARIQRQLSRMHTPEYVTSLEVVSVEPGCTAPTLSRFAAVSQPASHAAFPQLIFDMKYSGSFTVTIECKVDIRDAPAWSALDQAIDRIEGKRKKGKDSGGKIKTCTADEDEEAGLVDLGSDDENELVDGEEEDDGYEEERLLHASSSSDDTGPIAGSPKRGAPSSSEQQQKQPPKRHLFGQIRQKTAQKLRKLADSTATRISNLPLRVSLTFSVLEGTMCVWIPPPPGDRLFWSFLSPPKLSLTATPQIGQRLLKYAYHASRASAWIQARLELAFRKNLVFPCGGDIPLPFFLPVWNPRAYDGLRGLQKERDKTSATRGEDHRQEGDSRRPPVQVTRQEDHLHTRENEVSVSRVSAENAASTSKAAPFVEFSLRPPRNNNGGA